MIRFQKLAIENFMSYRDRTIVPLAGQGIVRIEGKNEDDGGATSNMAGKSTIMEALLWCLFGKTLRGLKHGQVVNRKSQRSCKVSCTFEISGRHYKCIRYRADKIFKHRLRVFSGDKPLAFRHGKNVQSKLEEILGCDFAAFVNSTVFGGFDGSRKQFALLTDSDQKRVLDSFLRFEKFELALDRTKEMLSKSREQLTETQLQIVEAKGKVNTAKGRVKALLDSSKVFKDKERKDRDNLWWELKSIVLPNPKKYLKEIEKAEEQVETFSTKLNSAKVTSDAASRSLNKLRKQIRERKSLRNKTCPTCGSKLLASTVEKLLEHLRRDRKSLKEQLRESELLVTRYERKVEYGSVLLKDLQKKQNKIYSACKIRMGKRTDILKRLKSLRAEYPFSSQIEEAKMEYSQALGKLLVYRQKNIELTKRIKALLFWETGFGNRGVKTLVMREILPSMNRKLKEYASKIFQSKVELEFRPSKKTKKGAERELFHLHYKSKFNSTSYLGESSGGRRRIDICVLLVFSWLARTSNLLLLDELLDGLDDAGREAVLHILSGQRDTVFVITHKRELKNSLGGKVWLVRKRNGVSRLEIN